MNKKVNKKIENAIYESIQQGRIVHIEDPTAEDLAAVDWACEGSVENGPEHEFWGRDHEDGHWRIHLKL